LLLSIDNDDFDLLKIISVAVREMSEGGLQIEKARRLDITEDIYYEIIRKKTATLIAACCALELGLLMMRLRICVNLVSS
jgi:octaprenyl-diphosphate synthase